MPATYDVPEDVIIAIIAELDTDRQTLRACVSVARSFRAPAQKQLYSHIVLHLGIDPSKVDRVKQLHSLFTESPHLRTYVRSLKLDLIPENAEVPKGIFHHLSQLRTLQMYFRPLVRDMSRWNHLSHDLQTDFYHVIQSPRLEQLIIVWLDGLPITHLPQHGLHELKITDVCLFREPGSSLPVDSLRISRIDCSLLRTDSIETCQLLIDLLPGSLEHLRLSVNNGSQGTYPTFDKLYLSSLKHLRSLQLVFLRRFERTLPYLREFLERSLPPMLEKIKFEHMGMSSYFRGTLRDADRKGLDELDELLASAASLAKIHISFSLDSSLGSHVTPEVLLPIPRLVERGGISIEAGGRCLWTRSRKQDSK